MTERAEFDKSRDEANFQLIEGSRDAVDSLCSRMIDTMFERFQKHLADDREELDAYFASGMPKDKSAELYVSPTMLEAPMTGDDYNEALGLKLVFSPLIEGIDSSREGDTFFVYMPMPRADYHYPDPLQGPRVTEQPAGLLQGTVELSGYQDDEDLQDTGDKPTELYFQYVPRPDKGQPSVRYMMQRDVDDPKYRYRVFRYTIPEDGDEMHVYDAVDIMVEGMGERITEDSEDAMKLIRLLANFTVVKQKDSNPHPSAE